MSCKPLPKLPKSQSIQLPSSKSSRKSCNPYQPVGRVACLYSHALAAYVRQGYTLLLRAVGAEYDDAGNLLSHDERPTHRTVLLALLFFLLFLVIGILAVNFPTPRARLLFTILSSFLITALGTCIGIDLLKVKGRYKRNLGNTVLVVIFTMILFTILYSQVWYGELNTLILQLSQDVEENPRFPSVAVLQDYQRDRPRLKNSPKKCFAGDYDEKAPQIEALTRRQYMKAPSVRCEESWSSQIRENVFFPNGTTSLGKYLQFTPPPALFSKRVGFNMQLQVFFDFNGTRAKEALSSKPFPRLSVVVFDPTYDLPQALATGYAPLNLIDANGYTSIILNLRLRHSPGAAPVYDYDTKLSTSPDAEIVCDVSQNQTGLCHTTLQLQFQNHDRTNISQKTAMSSTDVAASAGAYFSFVQFLSWIVSGQIGA